MGIIKAIKETVGGSFADQWLEVVEPEDMGDQTVMTRGICTGKGANKKGGRDMISNGSVIHVYEGQFMMLMDGGKIVDYSAEPGYFTVDNSSMPSMFSGDLDDVLKSSFDRFRFGGAAPTAQKVYYLNLQEIKGIKFGTRNPINYFDNFYNAEPVSYTHLDVYKRQVPSRTGCSMSADTIAHLVKNVEYIVGVKEASGNISHVAETIETVSYTHLDVYKRQLYTYEDKYYAVPKDVDTIALWYNKTMFEEAGLDYPTADWTWDDVTAVSYTHLHLAIYYGDRRNRSRTCV